MADPPNQPAVSRTAVLAVTSLASFLTPFMAASVNVALPFIGGHFRISALTLSWIATSYTLAAAVFLLPFGRLADIHGRKRIFLIGAAAAALAALLSGLSPTVGWLMASRVLHGISAALMFGTGVAILTSVIPPGERGRALGINVAATYIGLSAGPVLGGLLTQHFGWRSVFAAQALLSLAVVAAVAGRLKGEWAEARGESFDLTGALLYGVGLLLLMSGFSRLNSLPGALLTAGGLLFIAGFARYELSAGHPLLDVRLFGRSPVFALSNAAALIHYSATFALGFLLSLYLQYIKGLTPQAAGAILVAQPVVMALFSPLAGRLSDRIQPRIVASAGMAVSAAGLFFLARLDGTAPLSRITLALMVMGLGFALFSSPNMSAIMGAVERRLYGVASATAGTMRLVGMMMSMGLSMMLIALFAGGAAVDAEHHETFLSAQRFAFTLFGGLCLLGTACSLARGKVA